MGKTQVWKIILFHLPSEGSERLKSFVVVFLCTYKNGFSFVFLWVEIQHQMEVLNPVYMAPNKDDKKTKVWIFILHCLMKRDGVDKMFPFEKQDSEWGSTYEQKK